MKYKLVAVDIDGTLVGEDLVIRDNIRRALHQCAQQGLVVTLATGRMFQSTKPYAEKLGLDVPLITYNGALVKHSGTGEVYHHRTIPLELAHEIVRLCKELGLHLHTYVDDEYYVEEYSDWSRRYEEISGVTGHAVGDLEKFLTREPTKFIISEEPEKLEQYIDYLWEKLSPKLYLARSRPIFLEILHPSVSKLEGLRFLGECLGIQLSEMMAIGDAYNDVEMLKGVGLGVAMGNAPPDVQAQADWVTAGIEEEGLVVALEKFILKG